MHLLHFVRDYALESIQNTITIQKYSIEDKFKSILKKKPFKNMICINSSFENPLEEEMIFFEFSNTSVQNFENEIRQNSGHYTTKY